ncbi:MAG: DUF1207 domain-containing protein [Thermoanaerobaculales bacterium]
MLLTISAVGAAADEPAKEKSRRVTIFLPTSHLYPAYIADPLRPQNALTLQWVADTEIPETGAARFGLRLGGSLSILRWYREGNPDRAWQLSFEGGFAGQFDIEYSWDNTGWDGFYGVYLSRMLNKNLGFRFGSQHDSSHIGDEYSDRTGRTRIHYTREEGILGVSWRFKPQWRTYAEIGYGNGLSGFPPWRIQSGLEYVSEQRYWNGRASRYAAIDLRSYQETDWNTRVTAQVGYRLPVGDQSSVHRLALEFGTGRSVMGQFLWEKETWLAIGWYYDF